MDDRRIEEIRQVVLARLHGGPEERAASSLEARVAALEAAVTELRGGLSPHPRGVPGAPRAHTHPSLVVLSLPPDAAAGEPGRCVMEPDKPCVQSGACRTFGH